MRTIALAILALSLILRPLAASLGELHEFAHNPTNQHQDIGDLPTKASITDGAKVASEGDNAEPLHLLLHFAHCCGHAAATPSEFHLQAFNSPPASRPTWQLQATVASARWKTPFRPPITV
ncbi:MAG: hypothetical protein JSR70_08375 [Proteobacteria bacterium]|nr:hypothetical protein [Pseudomonadota bacterium]